MKKPALAGVLFLAAAMQSVALCAQDYPTKPLRAITVSGAGGAGDFMQRLVIERLGQALGQNVVIDYRPGANGIVAATLAADAAADGYTLFISNVGAVAINPALYKKLPYDPLRDFDPLTLAITSPIVLVVNNSVPANTVKELIALAKAKPDTLTIGYPGSAGMLTGHMFLQMGGIDLVQVPYKTVPGAMTDLIGGRIQIYFAAASNAVPQIKAGKIKALGVTTEARAAVLSDVPTIAEAGLAGFRSDFWFAFFVPRGTPGGFSSRLSQEIITVLKSPDVQEKLTAQGDVIIASTPQELRERLKSDIARFRKVAEQAKIPLQ